MNRHRMVEDLMPWDSLALDSNDLDGAGTDEEKEDRSGDDFWSNGHRMLKKSRQQ